MKKVTKIDKIQPSQTSKKKLRVAAYCRVSTDSDAQLESLDVQKEHYKNYITSRDDWTFAGLYFDEGITGTKADKRPMLLRLIATCMIFVNSRLCNHQVHQPSLPKYYRLLGDSKNASVTGYSDLFREGKYQHRLDGK